jgi:hypothetical protein
VTEAAEKGGWHVTGRRHLGNPANPYALCFARIRHNRSEEVFVRFNVAGKIQVATARHLGRAVKSTHRNKLATVCGWLDDEQERSRVSATMEGREGRQR